MRQYIRKADIILFIILTGTSLALSAFLVMRGNAVVNSADPGANANAKVLVKSGGRLVSEHPLSEDAELEISAPAGTLLQNANPEISASPESEDSVQYKNYNIVTVKNAKVSVSKATCRNQVCVHHESISHPGESIVCLPNRLVVSIEYAGDGEGGGYDSITS